MTLDFETFDVLKGLELARYNLHIKQKEIIHNSHTESMFSDRIIEASRMTTDQTTNRD
jgi:hypothetical protein